MVESCFDFHTFGAICKLKVISNASHNRIDTVEAGQLRVRVTATPMRGKANKQVLKLLAQAWDVPYSSLEIIQGAMSRSKTVLINDNNPGRIKQLNLWLKEHQRQLAEL